MEALQIRNLNSTHEVGLPTAAIKATTATIKAIFSTSFPLNCLCNQGYKKPFAVFMNQQNLFLLQPLSKEPPVCLKQVPILTNWCFH